ncbi:MAG: PorP/SprF family type IX secretion system membrane protein [Saprospiraceae bacterium]|nr:PorP/SprF family type IX secretion system membrane protein [Saprospiraceae bacterium]
MKKYTLPLIILLFPLVIIAQQKEHYSMYMLNTPAFNPGVVGMSGTLEGTLVYRDQWAGLEGAPRQANFNMQMPFMLIGGGIGFDLNSDNRGATQDLSAGLSYSYLLRINQENRLGLGLRAGFYQRSLDGSKLRAPEGSYELGINHNDPLLPEISVSGLSPLVDAGIYWINSNFEFGVSAQNLIPNGPQLDINGTTTLEYQQEVNVTAFGQTSFEIGSSISVKPSVLVRTAFVETETHVSISGYYEDFLMLGVSYRGLEANTQDAISILGGVQINDKLFLAYSYDLTLSDLALVSNGSHEILLSYNLGRPIGQGRPPKVIYNPRF